MIPLLTLLLFSAAGWGPPVDVGQDADSLRAVQSNWQWGFRLNANLFATRDDLLAPLRYLGPELGIAFRVERVSPANLHRVEINLGFAAAFNHLGHGAAALPWGARVVALQRIRSDERDLEIYLGGALVSRTDNTYFVQWDDSHQYWFASHAVGPSALLNRRLPSGRVLQVTATLPIIALVGRPPEHRLYKVDHLVLLRGWTTDPSRSLEWQTLPEFAALDVTLGAELTRRLRIEGQMAFRTTGEPRRVSVLDRGVALQWTFGGRP